MTEARNPVAVLGPAVSPELAGGGTIASISASSPADGTQSAAAAFALTCSG